MTLLVLALGATVGALYGLVLVVLLGVERI